MTKRVGGPNHTSCQGALENNQLTASSLLELYLTYDVTASTKKKEEKKKLGMTELEIRHQTADSTDTQVSMMVFQSGRTHTRPRQTSLRSGILVVMADKWHFLRIPVRQRAFFPLRRGQVTGMRLEIVLIRAEQPSEHPVSVCAAV